MTVVFALSGGGNLGPMEAGTVLALMEGGIEPDLMVGTSVGALNAAFLSTRPGVAGARALVAAWSTLRRRDAFRFNVVAVLAGLLGMRNHLFAADQLRRLIRRWVQVRQIQHATVPFAVVATDALTGGAVVLSAGDVVDSLVASAAIPGLFPPVRMDGRWLIDGGLSANVPVLQAQALGADDVYVITTTTAPQPRPPRGAVAASMSSGALVTARAAQDQLATAIGRAADTGGRVLVVPSAKPPAPGPFDFRRSTALADGAYRRTTSWLESEAPPRRDGSGSVPLRGPYPPDAAPVSS